VIYRDTGDIQRCRRYTAIREIYRDTGDTGDIQRCRRYRRFRRYTEIQDIFIDTGDKHGYRRYTETQEICHRDSFIYIRQVYFTSLYYMLLFR